MEQVETFTSEASAVEKKVNQWLRKNKGLIKITARLQSYAVVRDHPTGTGSITPWLAISIWYIRTHTYQKLPIKFE